MSIPESNSNPLTARQSPAANGSTMIFCTSFMSRRTQPGSGEKPADEAYWTAFATYCWYLTECLKIVVIGYALPTIAPFAGGVTMTLSKWSPCVGAGIRPAVTR